MTGLSKTAARLRTMRDVLGRTGEDGEGEDTPEAGFTLIELMVVLLIMGILLAIAIPTFLGVTGSAHAAAAKTNVTSSPPLRTGLPRLARRLTPPPSKVVDAS